MKSKLKKKTPIILAFDIYIFVLDFLRICVHTFY